MDMRILPLEERLVMDAAGFADITEYVVASEVVPDAPLVEASVTATAQGGEVAGVAFSALQGVWEAFASEGWQAGAYVKIDSADLSGSEGEVTLWDVVGQGEA